MSTLRVAKTARNYTPAGRREDACQGCMHVDRRVTVGITTWWCLILACPTSALAICDDLAIRPEEVPHAG